MWDLREMETVFGEYVLYNAIKYQISVFLLIRLKLVPFLGNKSGPA